MKLEKAASLCATTAGSLRIHSAYCRLTWLFWCLSFTFDDTANLTSALEAAGDKASRTGFLSFMRILAVGYPGTDESFRAFLEERPSICLTFSEISDHVTTLVQVGERGRFCRAFFAGLEDGIYNLPERSPAAAAMPMPVAALTDGMPSTKHETT